MGFFRRIGKAVVLFAQANAVDLVSCTVLPATKTTMAVRRCGPGVEMSPLLLAATTADSGASPPASRRPCGGRSGSSPSRSHMVVFPPHVRVYPGE